MTEMGEFIVGGYLKEIEGCEFVDYNVRVRGGGLAGLNELDVLGLHFAKDTAYLCEVTTHTRGLIYKSYSETVARVRRKFQRQRDYARQYLRNFRNHRFMFWSPVVPRGAMLRDLCEIKGLELVVNEEYTKRVVELKEHVRKAHQDLGNPFLRALQILACLREPRKLGV